MAKSRMTNDEVIQMLAPLIDGARTHREDLSQQDQKSRDLYHAEPLGNERDNWSSTVDPVAANHVNWLKANLSAVFEGDFFNLTSDNEERAEKFKKLIRNRHFVLQRGRRLNRDFIHDALVNASGGVLKVYYCEEYDLEPMRYKRMTWEQLAELSAMPNVTVSRFDEVVERANPTGKQFILGEESDVIFDGVENVKALRKKVKYRGAKCDVVPSWEFYYTPGYPSLELCPLKAHRVKRTMAYVRKKERAGEYLKGSYERLKDHIDNRRENEDSTAEIEQANDVLGLGSGDYSDLHTDPMTYDNNEVWIWECYFKADVDKDGFLEDAVCSICEDVVLSDPQEHPYGPAGPFIQNAPFSEPHMMEQKALPLQLESEQKQGTNLRRLIVDSAAESTYSTAICANATAQRDWQHRAIGDAVVGRKGEVDVIQSPSPSQYILRAYELERDNTERKTGISSFFQGGESSSMGKTATGIQMVMGATQLRIRYTAEDLSLAFEELIRRYIQIIQMYPDAERQVVVAGGQIELDEDDLRADLTISVNVGVGPQDKAMIAAHLGEAMAFGAQAGVNLGIMTPAHVARIFQKKMKLMDVPGYRDLSLPPEQIEQNLQQNQMNQNVLGQLVAKVQQMSQQGVPPQVAGQQLLQDIVQLGGMGNGQDGPANQAGRPGPEMAGVAQA